MKNFFSKLFKRKIKYRFILKSGASFVVKCSDLKISYNKTTMALTQYSAENGSGEIPFHCSPTEIAAIIQL